MSAGLLFLNLVLYVVVAVIAGWAINYSIDESFNSRKCQIPSNFHVQWQGTCGFNFDASNGPNSYV